MSVLHKLLNENGNKMQILMPPDGKTPTDITNYLDILKNTQISDDKIVKAYALENNSTYLDLCEKLRNKLICSPSDDSKKITIKELVSNFKIYLYGNERIYDHTNNEEYQNAVNGAYASSVARFKDDKSDGESWENRISDWVNNNVKIEINLYFHQTIDLSESTWLLPYEIFRFLTCPKKVVMLAKGSEGVYAEAFYGLNKIIDDKEF